MNCDNNIKSTIVSAFVSNVNFRDDRTIQKYFDLGKLLIACDVPKIIFLDEDMYHFVVQNLGEEVINNNNIYIYYIFKSLFT